MTADRRLKMAIRERMALTGENYATARRRILEERDSATAASEPGPSGEPEEPE